MSPKAPQIYHSFLVRCWLIPPAMTDEPPVWRFELREVTVESLKHGFSDLEQLNTFITAKLAALAAGSNHGDDKDSSI